MKISDGNIQELYKFTRQHYVEHYDVQTELVDHLANDIEEIWKENPNIDFDKAKNISFNKFGVFGFMDIYESKQKQMNKKYRKIMWSFIREWFSLPKVILTSAMVLLCYTLFRIPTIGKYSFYLVGFVIGFTKLWQFRKKRKQQEKNNSKRWLLEDTIFYLASSNILVISSNVYNILTLPKLFISIGFSFLVLYALCY